MKTRLFSSFILAASLFTVVGCNKESTPVIPKKNPSITLDRNEVSMYVGQNDLLVATTENFEGTVTWESSNPGIASVSQEGLVYGEASGTCVVTATADSAKAMATIEIKENKYSFTLNSENILLNKNKTFMLKPTLKFNDQVITDAKYTYEISKSDVLTIDSVGKITAVNYGTSVVTVKTSREGLNFSTSATVVVESGETMSMNTSKATIYNKNDEGQIGTVTLVATVRDVEGEDMPEASLTWSSSNSNVVTVNNGVVTAVNVGEANVVAEYICEDGNKKSCFTTVTVDYFNKVVEIPYIAELLGSKTSSFTFTGLTCVNQVLINGVKVPESKYNVEGSTISIDNSVFSGAEFATTMSFVVEGDYRYNANLIVYSKFVQTKADFYMVLEEIAKNEYFDGYVVLANDIDCEGDVLIGYGKAVTTGQAAVLRNTNAQNPEKGFRGKFIGNGYKISNFSMTLDTSTRNGLFGEICKGGLVKDLIIEYAEGKTFPGYGGIVAYNVKTGTIENVLVKVSSLADGNDSTAGFAMNVDGTIRNSLIISGDMGAMNNAYLLVKNVNYNGLKHVYGVSEAAYAHIVKETPSLQTCTYGSYKSLALLGEDEKVELPALTREGARLLWCGTKFDVIGETVKHELYVEQTQSTPLTEEIPFLNGESLVSIDIEGKPVEFTQNGNYVTFAGDSFANVVLGYSKINYETSAKVYSAKIVVCSDIITTTKEFCTMMKAYAKVNGTDGGFKGYYVLGNDLDFNDEGFTAYDASGTDMQCLANSKNYDLGNGFNATFDGRGYAIKNYTLPWSNENAALFGNVTGGGVIKNTLFKYKTGTTFNGYSGMIAKNVYGQIINNAVVIDGIRDDGANSPICYGAVQNSKECVSNNIVVYKGTSELTKAALICRDSRGNGTPWVNHNVVVTSLTTTQLVINSTGDYNSKNARVASLDAAIAQGEVEGYGYIKDCLTKLGEYYFWNNTRIA